MELDCKINLFNFDFNKLLCFYRETGGVYLDHNSYINTLYGLRKKLKAVLNYIITSEC